jgi:hypothetical protein
VRLGLEPPEGVFQTHTAVPPCRRRPLLAGMDTGKRGLNGAESGLNGAKTDLNGAKTDLNGAKTEFNGARLGLINHLACSSIA